MASPASRWDRALLATVAQLDIRRARSVRGLCFRRPAWSPFDMRVPFGSCLHPGVLTIGETMDINRKDNLTPEQMARFLELALGDEDDAPEVKEKIMDWMGVTERTYRSYINQGVCAKKWRVKEALHGLAEEITLNFEGNVTHWVYISYCKYVFEGVGDWEGLEEHLKAESIIVDALFLARQYALMGEQTKKMVNEMFLTIGKAGLSRRHYKSVLTKETDSHCGELPIEPDTRETRIEHAVEEYFFDQIEKERLLGMSDEDFAKYDGGM